MRLSSLHWLRYSAVCGEIKIDVPALALPLNGGNMAHCNCVRKPLRRIRAASLALPPRQSKLRGASMKFHVLFAT
jgi:hypothetical protein